MSLVDYASSSEDEDAEVSELEEEKEGSEAQKNESPVPILESQHERSISSSHQQQESSHSSTVCIEKLPDASILLNSPTFSSHQMSGSDHSSRVAAAIAESASRKRESNGSVSSYPCSKVPRGNLRHSRNIPDTVGAQLVPPQLSGRSNVITEDIGKLFVRRRADPSPH